MEAGGSWRVGAGGAHLAEARVAGCAHSVGSLRAALRRQAARGAAPEQARSLRRARAALAPRSPPREAPPRCACAALHVSPWAAAAPPAPRRARAMPDVRDLMLQWAERCVLRNTPQRLKSATHRTWPLTLCRCFAARAPRRVRNRPLHSPQLINACAGAGAGTCLLRLSPRVTRVAPRASPTLSLAAPLLFRRRCAQVPWPPFLCARWTW